MRERLIGLGGVAESGKTTSANMLVDIAQPNRHEHIEFSDPILTTAEEWLAHLEDDKAKADTYQLALLSRILRDSMGLAVHPVSSVESLSLNPGYLQEVLDGQVTRLVTPETKTEHRPLLEWLGQGAIHLVAPDVWSQVVEAKIHKARETEADLITVGGVRTQSNYGTIRGEGGKVIRLHRGQRETLLSETELRAWAADFEVDNNGSLRELRMQLERVWNEVHVDKLVS